MNYIILTLLCFLLSCCSSNIKSPSVHKLNRYFKENYSIDDGYLIALYDLLELNNTKLYSSDYGLIINNNYYYKSFLEKSDNNFSLRKINQISYNRVTKLKTLILELNIRYQFLSKTEENIIQNNNLHRKGEYFKELIYLDKLISNLPITSPMFQSKITSNYGMRSKGRNLVKFHHGVDLQAKHNSVIFATGDGIVKNACRQKLYGNIVEIVHSNKFITKYAHLNNITVSRGDKLNRGHIIGTQGKTGNATGEHLHHEILYCTRSVNPMLFLGHFFNYVPKTLTDGAISNNNITNKNNFKNQKTIYATPKMNQNIPKSKTGAKKASVLDIHKVTNDKINNTEKIVNTKNNSVIKSSKNRILNSIKVQAVKQPIITIKNKTNDTNKTTSNQPNTNKISHKSPANKISKKLKKNKN